MIEAYDGDEPYLFVSYAHADSAVVFGEIERLTQFGMRVWYDEGIDAGNDWPDEIGRALAGAAHFVVFMSPRAVASKNVQNEINMALNRGKPFLAVYLEETELSVGLELRMGDIQALMKFSMEEDHFHRKLQRVLPTELRTVERTKSTSLVKRVKVEPRGELAQTMSLRLPTDQGERNVCLVAGEQCRLGKDRSCDFVLRVLPRSMENDVRSRQISGHHADLTLTEDAVHWKNAGCANGTMADGRRFDADEQFDLNPGMLVRPANVLPLHVDVFDSAHFNAPADLSALNQFGGRESPVALAPGRINAVVLRRMDDYLDREQYVLIRRGAMIGRGPTCAIRIDDPSLSNRHAKLYALAGGVWIEPMDAASIVIVNGRQLEPDDLAAVTPGTEIECSSVRITVSPRFQHELGFLNPQPGYAIRDA